MDGVVTVAQINTGDDAGTPPSITYTGNGGVSSSAKKGSGGGGGGGGSKKATSEARKKKSDMVDRYKEIND
jgi:hypothetical protein